MRQSQIIPHSFDDYNLHSFNSSHTDDECVDNLHFSRDERSRCQWRLCSHRCQTIDNKRRPHRHQTKLIYKVILTAEQTDHDYYQKEEVRRNSWIFKGSWVLICQIRSYKKQLFTSEMLKWKSRLIGTVKPHYNLKNVVKLITSIFLGTRNSMCVS